MLSKGTGGTIGQRRGGGGGAAPATAAVSRAEMAQRSGAPTTRLEADEPPEEGHGHVGVRLESQVGAGPSLPAACAVAQSVVPSNGTAEDRAVNGSPSPRPSSVSPACATASSTSAGGASIVIGTTHRTCGMLRRSPYEESPDAHAASRRPRPAFTLTDQHGKKVKLSDFKGKPVVVYFYPKADTPGCTTQSCGCATRNRT